MRRRALLASLAAGVAGAAGCSSPGGSDGPTTSTDPTTRSRTPPPTTDSPPNGWGPPSDSRASVVDLETGPRTYAFAPSRIHTDDRANVRLWFDRTATADHPARLRGIIENANDFENTFRVQWIPVVGRVHGRQPRGYDHEASLHLAPTANNDLATTVPEVVRDDSGYWRATDLGPWMAETYRMAPGERASLEYLVVGDPEMTGRPTGTYEFRGDGATARLTVWATDSPGPETSSRFTGRSVPGFADGPAVTWYHEASQGTRAFVRPTTERLELDGLVTFEMVNHSRQTLQCGHWNLHKLVDSEWFHVGPLAHTADCRLLAPGARRSWALRAFNGESVPAGEGCGDGFTRGYLGGGEYGVVAGYGTPDPESGALVELVGDPVRVVPTADATVERDGRTVTVTTDRYRDGEHPPDATVTLTRTDTAPRRLLAEQIMRTGGFRSNGRGLRNLLAPMAADLDRVHLRTDEHVADSAVGDDQRSRRFRFRGQAYQVRRTGSHS